MPSTDPTETTAEALAAVLADVRLTETYRPDLEAKHAAALQDLTDNLGGHSEEAADRLAETESKIAVVDHILEAAKERIARRGVATAAGLQILSDELRVLLETGFELVRSHVQEAINNGPGKIGWWTNAELLPLVVRSRPVREWHRFENEHQPTIRTNFTHERNAETGEIAITLHENTVREPQQIIRDYERLTASIESVKAKIEALKREFSRRG